jgi:hypothetical protein
MEIDPTTLAAVATRHGWDVETAKKKIQECQKVLFLKSPQAAAEFMLLAPLPSSSSKSLVWGDQTR